MSNFKAKMQHIADFGWGSTPDSAGGAYSAPPDALAGFKGPYFYGEGEGGKGKEGKRGKGCPTSQNPLKYALQLYHSALSP